MQRLDLHVLSSREAIRRTVEVLRGGGLVIFPTETTYGAGVDALNSEAVKKLLNYKARREGKPLSIAVNSLEMAEKFVEVNESAKRIYERFLPGPVTVVSRGRGMVAPGIESEFGTLGVRIPNYKFVLELVTEFGKPLTATSANMSDGKRPYNIDDFLADLPEKQRGLIDLLLDAGTLPHNPPSTVIDTTLSTPVVFRQGEAQVADVGLAGALEFISNSEAETKAIAGRLLLKHWNDVKTRGLLISVNGSLGMGKTIFAKGVAEFLQISDVITSPTYSYVEEYDFVRHGVSGKFFHLDIWKVESPEELMRFGVEEMLGPGKVVVVEWAGQAEKFLQKLCEKKQVKHLQAHFVADVALGEKSRKITLLSLSE